MLSRLIQCIKLLMIQECLVNFPLCFTRIREGNNMSVILITGASSGFGRLTAFAFARRGDSVYATMRDPKQGNTRYRMRLQQKTFTGKPA